MDQELPQPLPAAIEALGEPRAVHRASSAETTLEKIGCFFLGTGLLIEAVLACLLFFVKPIPGKEPPAVVRVVFFAGIPFLAAAMSGLSWLKRRRKGRTCALDFPEGFATLVEGRWELFRWDQVRSIWQQITVNYLNGVPVGTEYRYTVRRADGLQTELTHHLRDIERLGQIVAAESLRHQLPVALKQIRSGEEVDFDPLCVDEKGISYKQRTL